MATLAAKVSLHAGGGWEGHVFFLVVHPVTQKQLVTNFIVQVEGFCRDHKLFFDRDFFDKLLPSLVYDQKYGWLVPKEHLDHSFIVTSANNYLKQIQEELF